MALQAPLSVEFSQQNTGVGCHFSSKGLPDPGIELESPALAGGFFTAEPPVALWIVHCMLKVRPQADHPLLLDNAGAGVWASAWGLLLL